MTIIIVIIILILIVMGLMLYNYQLGKKIDSFSNTNQQIVNLNILQDFIDSIGEDCPPGEKIKRINDILIEKYEIKYSTIVTYNGSEYEIRATNVEEKHWDTLKKLYTNEEFADSIQTATMKYITTENEGERLPYLESEFARAKSAMFFPLYIDNVYIGYWIIEGSEPHEFDNIDTVILELMKNNIVLAIKTIASQVTLENIVRTDLFTGLNSAEYLYGEGKRIIDKYDISTICMFKIVNIQDINTQWGREYGNELITKISDVVKQNLNENYILVRYMGPKFVIVFAGIEKEGAKGFLEDLKLQIEAIKIMKKKEESNEESSNIENLDIENIDLENDESENNEDEEYVSPAVNIILTTYYKGTSIDGTTKKLEEVIDGIDGYLENIEDI